MDEDYKFSVEYLTKYFDFLGLKDNTIDKLLASIASIEDNEAKRDELIKQNRRLKEQIMLLNNKHDQTVREANKNLNWMQTANDNLMQHNEALVNQNTNIEQQIELLTTQHRILQQTYEAMQNKVKADQAKIEHLEGMVYQLRSVLADHEENQNEVAACQRELISERQINAELRQRLVQSTSSSREINSIPVREISEFATNAKREDSHLSVNLPDIEPSSSARPLPRATSGTKDKAKINRKKALKSNGKTKSGARLNKSSKHKN
ncbi:hypothetical protein K502DRAFT_346190 [Neoconidiobolus thromboides FSU 785]|nr:hypothetical protein K502DRAFT_346190 [Neoconidiobolus thromboides FSU 785]